MPAITENTVLKIDVKMVVQLLVTAAILAGGYTTLAGRLDNAKSEIVELRTDLRELVGMRDRTIVLETEFKSINQKLTRIEDLVTAFTSRRASLETDDVVTTRPAPPRARR